MEMATKTPPRTPYLMLTTILLLAMTATTTFAGVNVPRRSAATLPRETVPTTFFYNPPVNGAPPLDVLAMMESGKTSGFHKDFTSYNSVKRKDHTLQPTPYVTSNNFPGSHASVKDPELFQNADDIAVIEVQDKDVMSSGNDHSEFQTSTPLKADTQTEVNEGNKDISRTNFPEPEKLAVHIPSTTVIPNIPETNSIDLSGNSSLSTEAPEISNIIQVLQDVPESSTGFTVIPESNNDNPEANSVSNDVPGLFENTDFPEEELLTTENVVEMMTRDEAEGEKTTLSPLVAEVSHSEKKEEGEKETGDPNSIKEEENPEKKTTSENQNQSSETQGDSNKKETPNDISNTKEANSQEEIEEEETLLRDNDSKKDDKTGGKLNTIFFTIEDENVKTGQLRVKVGKSLDYKSNQNTIEDKSTKAYQYHFQDPSTGWYKFGYGDNAQWRHEERRGDGIVLGRYGWHDATGKEHTTHFVADAKGYRIVHPGEEITLHVPTESPTTTTTEPPRQQESGLQTPTTLTTIQPFFTHKPVSLPTSLTTASFPITSVSTTVTLSAHQQAPTYPSLEPVRPSYPPAAYPGTVDELIGPTPDPSVVTGRPPIAYPLPHPSVSHRPGSWVFVSPTPLPPGSNRPHVRPPLRPFRPYPSNRPIKSPFRPVNQPRPKPNRPRPLKPLQPNLITFSRPHQDSEENEMSVLQESANMPDSAQSVDKDTIDSNPSVPDFLQFIPNYPMPSNIPSGSKPEFDVEPTDSNLSSGDLLHFINLINSLKAQGQASGGRPSWPVSPWSSSAIKVPHSQPSLNLRPPPALRPHSSTQELASSSVHGVYQDGNQQPPHAIDYAFMDEDYSLLGLKPILPNKQVKPVENNAEEESSPPFNQPFSDETIHDIPGTVYGGSVTWKIPVQGSLEVKPAHNIGTFQEIEGDKGSGIIIDNAPANFPVNSISLNTEEIKDQNLQELSTTSTSVKPASTSSPKPSSVAVSTQSPTSMTMTSTSTKLPSTDNITSTSTEVPSTDSVWPYISTDSSLSSTPTSNETTPLPPPPPPQNFWAEILNRIYYWPKAGPERPTIQ